MDDHPWLQMSDAESIRTRNASRALCAGPATPESLDPTPKNPVIANFFTQMGRQARQRRD